MRVLQLIDTLDAGGAEQMAVSFANALYDECEFSGLVSTRHEGILKNVLDKNVVYQCLNRKSVFDFSAMLRLKNYVKKNEIDITHAHGTSFFVAFWLKLMLPNIKIVYHEHFGARKNETFFDNIFLAIASIFFSEIIVVNLDLAHWCKNNLFCKKVYFLPNFLSDNKVDNDITFLTGIQGKRIVFLANLKNPKNHLFVLQAFSKSKLINEGWSIHLIGKIYNDDYSNVLKSFISLNKFENTIFLYDVCQDISHILKQANVGILASTDEGFPVTILEYANAKLLVLTSNVGYCTSIVHHLDSGLVFDPNNSDDLMLKFNTIIENNAETYAMQARLSEYCNQNFNRNKVILELLQLYKYTM